MKGFIYLVVVTFADPSELRPTLLAKLVWEADEANHHGTCIDFGVRRRQTVPGSAQVAEAG